MRKPRDFHSFYKSKSNERQTRFKSKLKKVDKRCAENATINISLLRDHDGTIRQVQGSRIPLQAEVTWTYIQLKRKAFEKMKRYNPALQDSNEEDVKLAYRSGEIAHFIPGTKIPFTLQAYKQDLGVKYNNINLYFMPFLNDTSDDDDKKYVTLYHQIFYCFFPLIIIKFVI